MTFTAKEAQKLGNEILDIVEKLIKIPEVRKFLVLRKLILKLENKVINENYEDLLMDIKKIKEVININE